MKILHYFLGFPPYRSGGLTRFAVDLMEHQVRQGAQVAAVWPGTMGWLSGRILFREHKPCKGVRNIELINPLPVPLDEGIVDTDRFMRPCDPEAYRVFLNNEKPDVIHIHTLMGLHRECLAVAKEMGIRMVFSTHDSFGICPKATMFRSGKLCEDDGSCSNCGWCNKTALSITKIRLIQSPLYRVLKQNPVMVSLRKRHRRAFFEDNQVLPEYEAETENGEKYRLLRAYYMGMLQMVDVIHFNSTVTEKLYKSYMTPRKSVVISISHGGIRDNRSAVDWAPGEKLRLTMLSPAKPYKGFDIIRKGLDGLWKNGKQDFELKLFSPVSQPSPYMNVREEGFDHCELADIMGKTDVLLAPSACYETFGFTVLEALSYGVPVIISGTVGAKDIMPEGAGVVLKNLSSEHFREVICALTPDRLKEMRRCCGKGIVPTMELVAAEIASKCYSA